jgi:hypothetical protein
VKKYFGALLIFGVLFGLLHQHLTGGLHTVSAVMIGRVLGHTLFFLVVAALILRPWKRRDPIKDGPPSFVGTAVTVGVLAGLELIGAAASP